MANEQLLQRIQERLNHLGLSERKACLMAGLHVDTIRSMRKGRAPRASTIASLARVLDVSPSELMGLADSVQDAGATENAPIPIAGDQSSGISIPEIDVRGGLGGGGEALLDYVPDGNGGILETDAVAGRWELPSDYITSELRVRSGSIGIIPVHGDSMDPTLLSGDRVMINLNDRLPSPPGIFALWDGLGVVVKRLEHVPHSDPAIIVISSDNPKHRTYERTIDEISIIGRVVWFARRL